MSTIDLTGKKGVVFGVANQRSIAWAIAETLAGAGAELAFTYQNERVLPPVKKATSALGDPLLVECDVTEEDQVARVYDEAGKRFGGLDIVVHSVAYAAREDLGGEFSATNREGFRTALEASAYSLMHACMRLFTHACTHLCMHAPLQSCMHACVHE